MATKRHLNNMEVLALAMVMNGKIKRYFKDRSDTGENEVYIQPLISIYGIPRGGIPVAYALIAIDALHYRITDNPANADVIVDDILDSGETAKKYIDQYDTPVFTLINKKETPNDEWYVFPWEGDAESSIEDNIRRIIQYIGDNPLREGLLETPARVAHAFGEWFSGYKYTDEMVKAELKCFVDGSDGCDEMVIRKDIPFYSYCEHHMAPIFGTCTVAYIPKDRVLGLSKMDRLVEIYARRLQVQERLTNQIADAMFKHLEPVGVGVYINARHMCVESRGVCNAHSETISIALRGAMKEQAATRQEFLSAAKCQK